MLVFGTVQGNQKGHQHLQENYWQNINFRWGLQTVCKTSVQEGIIRQIQRNPAQLRTLQGRHQYQIYDLWNVFEGKAIRKIVHFLEGNCSDGPGSQHIWPINPDCTNVVHMFDDVWRNKARFWRFEGASLLRIWGKLIGLTIWGNYIAYLEPKWTNDLWIRQFFAQIQSSQENLKLPLCQRIFEKK